MFGKKEPSIVSSYILKVWFPGDKVGAFLLKGGLNVVAHLNMDQDHPMIFNSLESAYRKGIDLVLDQGATKFLVVDLINGANHPIIIRGMVQRNSR